MVRRQLVNFKSKQKWLIKVTGKTHHDILCIDGGGHGDGISVFVDDGDVGSADFSQVRENGDAVRVRVVRRPIIRNHGSSELGEPRRKQSFFDLEKKTKEKSKIP